MQYFSTVPPSGHSNMSDFIRMANTPKEREAPSMVPQRYMRSGSSWGTYRSMRGRYTARSASRSR